VHATDATNASRTLLFDIHRGDWDDDLLATFSVPRSMLPRVVDSTGAVATVAAGLPAAGAVIAGIAGDQQAALFGQRCTAPGMAKNTYGTGCFLLQHTGREAVASQNRLLTTVALRRDGALEYALEGAVFTGGAVVQWLRDELGVAASAGEIDRLAASVPDSGGVVIVPAFTGLGSPHWDPDARGAVFGLVRGSNKAHLCRAALEAIALQTGELARCMQLDSGLSLPQLVVDGGASRSDLLLQLQADLLGIDVVRPADVESTARGAAMLAAFAVGFWRPDAALFADGDLTRWSPRADRRAIDASWHQWRRAVERTRGWIER